MTPVSSSRRTRSATAGEDRCTTRAVALFLLGYGWNLCFLGGGSQLATGLPSAARADVEGVASSMYRQRTELRHAAPGGLWVRADCARIFA